MKNSVLTQAVMEDLSGQFAAAQETWGAEGSVGVCRDEVI